MTIHNPPVRRPSGLATAAPGDPNSSPTLFGNCPLPADLRPPVLGGQGDHVAQGDGDAVRPRSATDHIMLRRLRQLQQFGHTPEQDLTLRARVLPDQAIRKIVNAIEDMQFHRPDWRARAQLHLADAGALICAAWDYLENGGGE